MRDKDNKHKAKKIFEKAGGLVPSSKVTSHLKEDIKEQSSGIRKDKGLIKSMKHGSRGR
jgi:hypothetical protein